MSYSKLQRQYEFKTQRGRITSTELRSWLDLHGLRQSDLAKALGVNTRTVNAWCNQRFGQPETPRGLHDELVKLFGKPYPPNDNWI